MAVLLAKVPDSYDKLNVTQIAPSVRQPIHLPRQGKRVHIAVLVLQFFPEILPGSDCGIVPLVQSIAIVLSFVVLMLRHRVPPDLVAAELAALQRLDRLAKRRQVSGLFQDCGRNLPRNRPFLG
jgi:hypothetical protein